LFLPASIAAQAHPDGPAHARGNAKPSDGGGYPHRRAVLNGIPAEDERFLRGVKLIGGGFDGKLYDARARLRRMN